VTTPDISLAFLPFIQLLRSGDLAPVGSGGPVLAAHRDNSRDSAAIVRVSVYVKY
jgi:hypothetical protein